MLKYEDLTQEQIDFISNGCGAKGLPIDVPDFVYEDACHKHDVNYWIGGGKADRKIADVTFYYDMVNAANKEVWYQRWVYKTLAWAYYRAVRWFAAKWFYFSDKKRTMQDLILEMNYGN